eukprot:TRINITY_DN12561_c0_g2_i11.p1 TRINITY_DN12561_c0_g2~~TRINITY_DN12561_c0_g2_i11.p1  ORF type:complete len:474 (+),score=80.68 TRINITY_DN12561_c0_g2_i11:1573-2994(+)
MAKSNSIDTSAGDVSEQIKAVASKCKWTGAQLDLFSKATDILLELRHHETVIRGAELQLHGLNVTGFDPLSAYVATSTSKLRELFADILWDKDQVLWLLKTIYDHHDEPHRQLCSRLLQRLHHKVPALVKATGLLEAPEFSIELRSWIASEPLKINWGQNESKPADALLVCLPCEWSWSSPMLKAWTELLGKKWTVGMQSEAPEGLDDLEETSELLLQKVVQRHPGRALGLVTYGEGAKVGLTMARKYASVQFLLNLAPSIGAKGQSGVLTVDSYKNLRVPSIVVLGSDTTTCDVQHIQEHMGKQHGTTRVIIMPNGDNTLRLSRQLKLEERRSQRMANMAVVEQIVTFVMEQAKYTSVTTNRSYLHTQRTVSSPMYSTSHLSGYHYGSSLQGSPISFMHRTASPVGLSSHYKPLTASHYGGFQTSGHSAYTQNPSMVSLEQSTSNNRAKRDPVQARATVTTVSQPAKITKQE